MAMCRLARGRSLHRTDGGRACRLGCGHIEGSWRQGWVRQGAVVKPRRTAVMARWRLGLPRPCPNSVVARQSAARLEWHSGAGVAFCRTIGEQRGWRRLARASGAGWAGGLMGCGCA
ncbi:hypothetical protein E2562_033509 [Oryza meyeriana var. granulata]|uniref:Uncharacterized protein n=1 Tax=Oryza meyeriana var. granulata TaxID=110450 RepID=A0A6G1ECA0_9ORYZ|nr:hypothetical protein E2562_033509 [Oryza meyeriana var. granulata]